MKKSLIINNYNSVYVHDSSIMELDELQETKMADLGALITKMSIVWINHAMRVQ